MQQSLQDQTLGSATWAHISACIEHQREVNVWRRLHKGRAYPKPTRHQLFLERWGWLQPHQHVNMTFINYIRIAAKENEMEEEP